ncbi:hypothetical protein BDN70DRAFT_873265 [Pholiota conissans]|uniref:Uncharacterized protein n=1 Tax=Pholiota conissans TaxID=109636 RepID=A0A9P5ZAE4_9AGAR|nr:hypothetical protein BDN70DRAFT_873265 [Pholiota conissans]
MSYGRCVSSASQKYTENPSNREDTHVQGYEIYSTGACADFIPLFLANDIIWNKFLTYRTGQFVAHLYLYSSWVCFLREALLTIIRHNNKRIRSINACILKLHDQSEKSNGTRVIHTSYPRPVPEGVELPGCRISIELASPLIDISHMVDYARSYASAGRKRLVISYLLSGCTCECPNDVSHSKVLGVLFPVCISLDP